MTITPHDFVAFWAQSHLREQQGAQSHFNQLCDLVGHKSPAEMDSAGQFFTFEEQVSKATGGQGRADVWYKGHFAWEYKAKDRDLDAAYAQLLAYKGGLDNPPLLVVCDFLEYRIYPQWPNTSGLPFVFHNEDLLDPKTLRFITWLLESPEKFLELRQSELERREQITLDLAYKFAHLADLMRKHKDESGKPIWEPLQIARFLTKLVFSLFAEDIGLMPTPFKQPVFRFLVEGAKTGPEEFVPQLEALFKAMDGQARTYLLQPVPYFNGGLFADSRPGAGDGTKALNLTEIDNAIYILGETSEADWRYVNPTIFGTLFEGALDESKRAQLGAHYTSEADIRLVIEPVLMQPLYRQWNEIQAEAEPLLRTFLDAEAPRAIQQAKEQLTALHDQMMTRLESTRVLDPACGSGNFLYVSLRALKDLEARVRKFFEPLGLPFRDVVTPRQLYGIERDEFAANLAHVVVWIGYLQWRYEDEGVLHPLLKETSRPHPRQLPHPILQDKYNPEDPNEPAHILCADSILRYDAGGKPYEPEWPTVDVIVGNPPFLGDKKMRGELKSDYIDDLRQLYEERIPGQSDLVCYWFEKARAMVEGHHTSRVGLLATNSIRGGANRIVLERIKETGDIFMAWSDRPWILSGAAVRISIVGFDDGSQKDRQLDRDVVVTINPDLTPGIDLTCARVLSANTDIGFIGVSQHGPFEIDSLIAQKMIQDDSTNSQVVRPIVNAFDITRRSQDRWVIDFGSMDLEQAQLYPLPFAYVKDHVLPVRERNHRKQYRDYWWLHGEARPAMRDALRMLTRYLATPRVAKHRLFVWLTSEKLPSDALVAIARDDDYFLGVLHSYLHEIWALRLGTSLEDRPRYTPTTTFETFPLPYPPGKEPITDPAYFAIGAAAKQLHEEREVWLNPPEMVDMFAQPDSIALKNRTLTNLYNALEVYREKKANGKNGIRNGDPASAFAPRLAELHDVLDAAVLTAYGWSDLVGKLRTSEGDEELLRRLLALNLSRAG